MKILVCGGRDYRDKGKVFTLLSAIHRGRNGPIIAVIHGGADGADAFAQQWARWKAVPEKTYRAEWEKYGRCVGLLRNAEMLRKELPDLVLAFPGGRGTADMTMPAAAGVQSWRSLSGVQIQVRPGAPAAWSRGIAGKGHQGRLRC